MLILTRGEGESVVLGHDVRITVLEIRGGKIRLGFEAPRSTTIHREEVYELLHGAPQLDGDKEVPDVA